MTDQAAPAVAPDTSAAPPANAGDPPSSPPAQQTEPAPKTGDIAPQTGAADWRDGLEGEYLEFGKRLASPQDAVKAAYDLRKANGAMVKLPGKDAKPEDIAKFHKIIGAPETPDGYFKPPAGEDFTESEKGMYGKFGEIFHRHHVPVAAAEEIHKAALEMADALDAERERIAVEARKNNEAALRKEWGADYEANGNLAGRAMKTYGGPEFAELLNKTVDGVKLGDHPLMIKAFGKIGRATGEASFIGAVGADQRQSIQQRIDTIIAENPVGTDKYKQPHIQKQLADLYAQLHGSAPIVGRENRAA